MAELLPKKGQLTSDDMCDCGEGILREGITEIKSNVDGVNVIFKNVPARVCDKCDEAYITWEISGKIDIIMRGFRAGKLPSLVSEVTYILV